MSSQKLACIILAAGKGTRMKSALPKVLHKVAGRSMVGHVLAAARSLSPDDIVVVVGPGMEAVSAAVSPARTVLQPDQLGTGHAAKAARTPLADFSGDILILYGDTPLITAETLRGLVETRRSAGAALAVLGMRPEVPGAYGRLLVTDGRLDRIVEAADATPEQRAVGLCNGGIMAVDGALLFGLLDRLTASNAKGEYYLTDIVALANADGRVCIAVEGSAEEVIGVNSRAELAEVERLLQGRLRRAAMAEGVTLIDPESVWFSADTKIERDVVVGPHVWFGPGVSIGEGTEIFSFCHFEGVAIGKGARVGPFARMRPGARIGDGAHIGNFVEVKNANVEAGAKANHLTYIGDARVGAGANIGAGTITVNYDGFGKYRTDIGAGAFIGSNSSLVAPVSIGDNANVGAGSVVTEDVPADALAIARGRQRTMPDRARTWRLRKAAEKAAKAAGGT
jgi:bifunctional UDP-N-acetylglucosamine pyrophosphorylase / glucosamine-1-phosphate N-acetyltransferase